VFFYNCKIFGFRALDEHKQLDASQFSISVDTNGNKELHYTGNTVVSFWKNITSFLLVYPLIPTDRK
jgi:hypothetical protein